MHIDISWGSPWFLLLLLLLPAMVLYYFLRKKKHRAKITLSTVSAFENIPKSVKEKTVGMPFIFRCLGLAFIIVALARPQGSIGSKLVNKEGIDLMFALDISTSMLAKDFTPNRLEASKSIATQFILERPSDRIGLVVFAGESFTQCPLTTDHNVLVELIDTVTTGMVDDGTAIGDGLATAVSRIKESQSKSKVVILLTDGVNNSGSVSPQSAGEIAKKFGIRVYCIGVGTMGRAMSPIARYGNTYEYGWLDVKIDETALKEIAEKTGGRYFRATDNESLKNVYAEIDAMEKTLFEVKEFENKPDLYFWVLAPGLLFLLIEFVLRNTVYRGIP